MYKPGINVNKSNVTLEKKKKENHLHLLTYHMEFFGLLTTVVYYKFK